MGILELDDSFQPKTELGKAMKMMVENGDYCDGNIYWLISLFEQRGDLLENKSKEMQWLYGKLNLISDIVEKGREESQKF